MILRCYHVLENGLIYIRLLHLLLVVLNSLPAIAQSSIECESDSDCSPNLVCKESKCFDPCYNPHTCGCHATCKVENHEPNCACPPGRTGNPLSVCIPASPGCKVDSACQSQLACPSGGKETFVCMEIPCDYNSDCPDNLACIDSFCRDPCGISGTCGLQAACEVINHQPNCVCPYLFTGNPSDACFPSNIEFCLFLQRGGHDVVCQENA